MAAFNTLLGQFGEDVLWLTLQDLLIGVVRLFRLIEAMEFDVSQKQEHQSTPVEDGSLIFAIRFNHQLLKQSAGDGMR